MTSDPQDPLAGPNAPQDGTPPLRPPPPPPSASGAVELPASTSDSPSEQLHLVHPALRAEDGEDEALQRPSAKPEGSAYASSYRPSEDRLSSVYVVCGVRFQVRYTELEQHRRTS
jgi:hypothetical protein